MGGRSGSCSLCRMLLGDLRQLLHHLDHGILQLSHRGLEVGDGLPGFSVNNLRDYFLNPSLFTEAPGFPRCTGAP